jgi:adenylate cyclase
MPSQTIVETLAAYFEDMESIVSHHQGLVDKYIGDAILALWNTPLRPAGDPEKRACAAALEYVERFGARRAEREAAGQPFVEAAVGIHAGEALVGNIGSTRRMGYTALGDAVNLASRLEGLNRVYGTRILLSEPAYEAVRDDFEIRFIDCVAVKGRHGAVRLYELLARRGALDPALLPLLHRFGEGLKHYEARDWRAAEQSFRQAAASGPRPDGPSLLYAARCREYQASPPPPDWDGVCVQHRK